MKFVSIVVLLVVLSVAGSHAAVRNLSSKGSFTSALENSPHGGIFVKFYAPWCGHCKAIAPAWESLGEKFLDSIMESNCDDASGFCREFGVSGYPTLKWFSKEGNDKGEDYKGGRDLDSLIQFTAEKLGVRIPKAPSSVITADDTSFSAIVLKDASHSFVEFYAPWCGHCKNLAPTWEKLANVFKNEPTVDIVKIDADANRVSTEPYGITGFPTLKFFPAGNKDAPQEYASGHDLESLVSFVNEKAGTLRLADGSLNSQAGRVAQLDTLAARYSGASEGDRTAIRAEAAAVSGVEPAIQKFYLAAMDRIAKDPAFVAHESVRIQRIIDSGSVADNKVDEFTKRINILSSFIADQ